MRLRRPALYVAFFLSGAAGLIYESVWTRYLGLFVGHSAYAQVIVLTVFLGGLSMGALWAGHFAERVRRPLLWYAGVEFAVGLIGFVFHDAFVVVTGVAQASLYPALAGGPALTVVKWSLASALILPPAVLLGTTFPLMSSGMLRAWPDRPGRTLSRLYFSNSLGAACGAIVAGFVLVGFVGLPGSILTAAVINIAVALIAWAVARSATHATADEGTRAAGQPVSGQPQGGPEAGGQPPGARPGLAQTAAPLGADPDLWRFLLAVSFGTALASFIYEIAWIRMLSLVLGSATHSFEIMLSAFILGLALGALFIQRRADRQQDALLTLGVIQWCMGAAALATLPVYLMSFSWLSSLMSALQPTLAGYRLFSLGKYGMAAAVMLPSTFCAGMTLPLITRVLLAGKRGEKAVGWVYGINTLGSIVGVVLASLLLLPLIGLKPLLVVGAGLDMFLGVILLSRWARQHGRRPALGFGAAAAAASVLVVGSWGADFDTRLLNSGVFRDGRLSGTGEVSFWRDGRTASVAVTRGPGYRAISTNGKPDASLSTRWIGWAKGMPPGPMVRDEPTQVLLPLITLAHNTAARDALVIGHGSGISAHVMLGSPNLEDVVTVEIEPAMIEGSQAFGPANARAFDDPRSHIVIDDAKSYFASSQRNFDLILSEPSNPWVSGVSSLFTREFYGLVSEHLSSAGVFGQWLHLYEIDDALILSVLAAIHENFASYDLFRIHGADILIVASNEDDLPVPDWAVTEYPDVASDLARTYPLTPAYLERTRFLTRAAVTPLVEAGQRPNSDFFPILDLGAEVTRYRGSSATGIGWTADADFDPSDVFLPALSPEEELGPAPIPAIRAFSALDLGERIRRATTAPPDATDLRRDPALQQALSDEAVLEGLMALNTAPVDWGVFMGWVRLVAGRRHGGLRGWADRDFYDRVEHFATAHEAPSGLVASLRFERAVRARDWSSAASTVAELVPLSPSPLPELDPWVDAQLTLNAGVMALLMVDEVEEARRLFDTLMPRVGGPDAEFLTFLLPSYLDYAEAMGGLPAGASVR